MQVLSLSNINKKFGEETLFSNVSFSINDHDRYALIGRNGTGKSTLLRIIIGEEEDSNTFSEPGYITLSKNCTIGYLSQDVISNIENTLLEEALLVFKNLIDDENYIKELSLQVAKDSTNKALIDELGKKTEQFEINGGYEYRYKIESILTKFGFPKTDFNRKISSFSGGERTKMAFAKLLLLNPNLLILDEPTNHLDVSTIDWLEGYLKSYNGAILFVSHDKYFINNLATSIIELENNKVSEYKGNFDSYVAQKQMNYETQLKQYNIQQKEIKKMERFIEYFKPKQRFTSRAKDREKKLEHLKRIEMPSENKKAISFSFQGKIREDKKIIDFQDLSIGYNHEALINHINLLLFGGDKLAVIGDNGSGKTTFLKTLYGELESVSGKIVKLAPLKIGYVKQNDFDLKGDAKILDYFNSLFPYLGTTKVRTHLGRFDFIGDDVFKTLDVLSGGEKMRVILAKIVLEDYDILLLDEPTNHLDLETKESLIEAMQDYDGCIIFVSHDRYFIDLVANKLLLFANNTSTLFNGGYSEYKEKLNNNNLLESAKSPKSVNSAETYKPNREKRVPQKIAMRLKEIENRIAFIEDDQKQEETYMDYMKMNEYNKEKNKLEDEYLSLLKSVEDDSK